jgi:hypothetical protein
MEEEMSSSKTRNVARSWLLYATGAIIGCTMTLMISYLYYHAPLFRKGGLLGGIVFVVVSCAIGLIFVAIFRALAPWEKRLLSDSASSKRK